MESIVHISAKDTGDNPPPKKKQRQMLIASMDTRISAGSTSNDIELNMKHVTIAATVNDYCNKQYYQCITSAKCTNNNASQVLKKMRQLIYCLHYLAQDDIRRLQSKEQKTGFTNACQKLISSRCCHAKAT